MTDILQDLINVCSNEYASVVSDGTLTDSTNYVDTGSYMLNALLSGSIFKGFPTNKILGLQGESATGKTYFLLSIIKNFLLADPNARVMLFETESAISKKMLEERGIPIDRVGIVPVVTVQQFRTQALRVAEKYNEVKAEGKPLLLALDSLGMLSTEKELNDVRDGNEIRDMTRAQLIKGTFRVLTLKLAQAGIPMIVTNHVYFSPNSFSGPEAGGGTGLKYAASYIVNLTKRKEKEGTDVVGNVITCTLLKGRDTKENSKVQVLLNYATGLNKFYGLVDLASEAELLKKVSTRYELADGRKFFEKQIYRNPQEVFTDDLLQSLDEYANNKFTYGRITTDVIEEEE